MSLILICFFIVRRLRGYGAVYLVWWGKVGYVPLPWKIFYYANSKVLVIQAIGGSFGDVLALWFCGRFELRGMIEFFAIGVQMSRYFRIKYLSLLLFGLMQWEILEEFLYLIFKEIGRRCFINIKFFSFLFSSFSVGGLLVLVMHCNFLFQSIKYSSFIKKIKIKNS